MAPTGQTYMDLTRKFVAQSSSGINYIKIIYDYDSNAILAIPLKIAKQSQFYQHTRPDMPSCVQQDFVQALCALQDYLSTESVDYQLVPPHLHWCNAAERAIWTFKNHSIAGLCSVDKDFPIVLWDQLILQAEPTLNLLRGSWVNPNLSAWAQLHGAYDFNHTPIVPPSICILIHKKPSVQGTWAPHTGDGWYLGPAMQLYR